MEDLRFCMLDENLLAECVEIAAQAPDPWTEAALRNTIGSGLRPCFVAVAAGQAVGFAAFLAVEDTADLEMLVVDEGCRKKGVARALLGHALEALARRGIKKCLLEVRQGNRAAVALYEKLGFKLVARRPGMYQKPAEDGLLMGRALDAQQNRNMEEFT